MSKRFVDIHLWRKEWFQDLSPRLKSFWFYLFSTCDMAGLWEPNFRHATFSIGDAIAARDMEEFGPRVILIPQGKYLLTGFVPFQNGTELSENCNAHRSIIRIMQKYNLEFVGDLVLPKGWSWDGKHFANPSSTVEQELPNQPMVPPMVGPGTSNSTSNSKGTSKSFDPVEFGRNALLNQELNTPEFREWWGKWVKQRWYNHKHPKHPEDFFNEQLTELAAMGHPAALATLRNSTINGYQGLVTPKGIDKLSPGPINHELGF